MKKTDYQLLREQLISLTAGVPHLTANLANASALLWQELDGINWAGFYLAEGDLLVLGPFQGKPACIEIPFGKGVCGCAAQGDSTVVVDDVHTFPALHAGGKVIGVLDIDSPLFSRFSPEDRHGLEQFAAALEKNLWGN